MDTELNSCYDRVSVLTKELKTLSDTHSTLLVALEYNRKERDSLKQELILKNNEINFLNTIID